MEETMHGTFRRRNSPGGNYPNEETYTNNDLVFWSGIFFMGAVLLAFALYEMQHEKNFPDKMISIDIGHKIINK